MAPKEVVQMYMNVDHKAPLMGKRNNSDNSDNGSSTVLLDGQRISKGKRRKNQSTSESDE